MSATKTKKPAAEAVEEGKTNAATEALTDEEKQRRQEEQDKAFFAKLPNPCVYCGPSVRGVARQYTVYNGGIPDVVKQFITEHPAAKGLLVSVERFAQVRIKLETRGTAEFILFNKVRAEL